MLQKLNPTGEVTFTFTLWNSVGDIVISIENHTEFCVSLKVKVKFFTQIGVDQINAA